MVLSCLPPAVFSLSFLNCPFFCSGLIGSDQFFDDPFFSRQHQGRTSRSHTGAPFFGGFGFPPFGAGLSPFNPGEKNTDFLNKMVRNWYLF